MSFRKRIIIWFIIIIIIVLFIIPLITSVFEIDLMKFDKSLKNLDFSKNYDTENGTYYYKTEDQGNRIIKINNIKKRNFGEVPSFDYCIIEKIEDGNFIDYVIHFNNINDDESNYIFFYKSRSNFNDVIYIKDIDKLLKEDIIAKDINDALKEYNKVIEELKK